MNSLALGTRAALLCAWLPLQIAACAKTTNLVGTGNDIQPDAGRGSPTSLTPNAGEVMEATPAEAGVSPVIRSVSDAGVVRCGKKACACSNAADDDGDGWPDALDPECIGPADDDEASFGTGAGHDRAQSCQDCFFDGNSGAGDDGCRRAASCSITGGPESGSGSCRSCEVTSRCVQRCRALTPNGCDCFGCCEVHLPGGDSLDVILRSGCSMATLSDQSICERCIKAPDCQNPCDGCELCLGKAAKDLPESCVGDLSDPDAPRQTCGDGEQVCDERHACPGDFYCQWGCCLPILL